MRKALTKIGDKVIDYGKEFLYAASVIGFFVGILIFKAWLPVFFSVLIGAMTFCGFSLIEILEKEASSR